MCNTIDSGEWTPPSDKKTTAGQVGVDSEEIHVVYIFLRYVEPDNVIASII